jgi:outer membrane protein assembly factor BamB
LKKKKIDWIFDTGSDMDGSPVVTNDDCLIITLEKEYIAGKGGAMKINPALPPDECVVWFFPTENKQYAYWAGGIIGSASVTDYYNKTDSVPNLAAFLSIDGYLYVVKHEVIDPTKNVDCPNLKKKHNTPELVFKYLTGPSISTPVIVGNKIVAATYQGVYLFEYDQNYKFKLLAHQDLGSFEATPFVWNKRIYVAGRNGFLHCFGE